MIFNAVFIAMICAFLVDDIKLLFKKPEVDTDAIVNTDLYVPTFFVPTVVIIITFLSMYLFDVLEKKFTSNNPMFVLYVSSVASYS